MNDIIGRKIDYARISITDRCNLSCVYCMPKGSEVTFLENDKLMSVQEIYTICDMLSKLGIDKIKLTGGEPLIRKDITQVVKKIRSIENIKKITLTTNGVLLDKYIDFLYENDIKDINISLDSLSPQKYNEITNFDLSKITKTIERLLTYKDMNIKINVVPINTDDEEIFSLIDLARTKNIKVRFIELMPIGYGSDFKFISSDDIIKIIQKIYKNYTKTEKKYGNGPATYYLFENFVSQIGFISAMSHNFCNLCNRIRITCEGKLKPCLNFKETLDIKTMLRENVDEKIIINELKKHIEQKPKSHNFLLNSKDTDNRKMYQIGG